MAEFKKLSEVELIEEVSDGATVLVEDGGEIKRVPKSAVGGAMTVVVETVDGENYVCNDVTFDQMKEQIVFGVPTYAICKTIEEGSVYIFPFVNMAYLPSNTMFEGSPETICLASMDSDCYWTADGISANPPSGGK